MDIKKEIIGLPNGEYTVFMTVDANGWKETADRLLSRFPASIEMNQTTRTASVSGYTDELLEAANAGLPGVINFVAFNNNGDIGQRTGAVATKSRSINGNYPLVHG